MNFRAKLLLGASIALTATAAQAQSAFDGATLTGGVYLENSFVGDGNLETEATVTGPTEVTTVTTENGTVDFTDTGNTDAPSGIVVTGDVAGTFDSQQVTTTVTDTSVPSSTTTSTVTNGDATLTTFDVYGSNVGPGSITLGSIEDDGVIVGNTVGVVESSTTISANSLTYSTYTGTATYNGVNDITIAMNATPTTETSLSAAGLTTTGAVSTGTLATSGNATVGGTLAVTGATTLTGALTANGGVSTTTLTTSGAATLNSAAVTNNLTVGGTTTLTGALTANGGVSTTTLATSGNATVGGALSVGTNLTVTGTTTTTGLLSANGGIATNNANVAVGTGQITAGTVVINGANGGRITGLTSGALTATSTEAVSGQQLFATNGRVTTLETSLTALTGRVSGLESSVSNLRDKAYQGIAMNFALNAAPLNLANGEKGISGGVGVYQGEWAGGVKAQFVSETGFGLGANLGFSEDAVGGGVGASFKF